MENQISQSNELPDIAEKYISRIIKKMRYRRKVRREVRQELTDHFVDALRGCRDEADRRELANQLIESFGDAKLLAKLIRRGKKRCRPLWIKAVIRSVQAIGVSIVLLIVYLFMFFRATPTISIDYLARWNEMARPAVDETENAYPFYEKAASLYVEPVPSIAEVIDSNGLNTLERFFPLTADEKNKIRTWIDQHASTYQSLTDEQRQAIEQCFAYNVVCNLTVPTRQSEPLYYPFNEYVNYLQLSILNPENDYHRPTAYQNPRHVELEDLPSHALLAKWLTTDTVPDQFETAVDVAVLREWIDRTQNEETIVFSDFGQSQYQHFTEWLERNEPAWRQFVAGSEKKYCWRKYSCGENNTDPQDRWLIQVLLPHLNELRNISRLGVWRAKLAEHQGNPDLAMNNCLAVIRVGAHFQQQKTPIIEQLVGLAISNLAHNQIIRLAGNPKLSSADLARIQKELENIYGLDYPRMDISGERLFFLDTIQHCFTEGGIGGGHIVPRNVAILGFDSFPNDEFTKTFIIGTGFLLHARRDETQAKAMELYEYMHDGMKMTPYQKKDQNMDFDEQLSKLPRYRYALINIMMPALDRAGDLAFRSKAEHQATLTVLALQRWKKENRSFPDTLDPLIQKGLLKELPKDPYTDGPLIYQRRNENFILYSFGEDFDDDGGVQSPDNPWGQFDSRDKNDPKCQGGDRVFWPVEK